MKYLEDKGRVMMSLVWFEKKLRKEASVVGDENDIVFLKFLTVLGALSLI